MYMYLYIFVLFQCIKLYRTFVYKYKNIKLCLLNVEIKLCPLKQILYYIYRTLTHRGDRQTKQIRAHLKLSIFRKEIACLYVVKY